MGSSFSVLLPLSSHFHVNNGISLYKHVPDLFLMFSLFNTVKKNLSARSGFSFRKFLVGFEMYRRRL